MEDEYNVVIDALQTKLNALEKMQKGCDNLNSSIGGGMGLMDCIRYEQMDELREAIKREKALSHVNETPKNEHDSDDVLNKAANLGMMREALRALDFIKAAATPDSGIEYHQIQAIEQALAAEPAPLVCLSYQQAEFLRFLNGDGTFEGVWFGDEHPEFVGRYWWRGFIEDLFAEISQSTEPAPLVRLTLSQKLEAIELAQREVLPETINRHHALKVAQTVMDAMYRINS